MKKDEAIVIAKDKMEVLGTRLLILGAEKVVAKDGNEYWWVFFHRPVPVGSSVPDFIVVSVRIFDGFVNVERSY